MMSLKKRKLSYYKESSGAYQAFFSLFFLFFFSCRCCFDEKNLILLSRFAMKHFVIDLKNKNLKKVLLLHCRIVLILFTHIDGVVESNRFYINCSYLLLIYTMALHRHCRYEEKNIGKLTARLKI